MTALQAVHFDSHLHMKNADPQHADRQRFLHESMRTNPGPSYIQGINLDQ